MGQLNLDFTMPGLSAKKEDTSPAKCRRKDQADATTKRRSAESRRNQERRRGPQGRRKRRRKPPPRPQQKKKEATPKAEEKKTDGSDDVLAPPPGTTITKFPKVEPKKNGIRDLCLVAVWSERSEDQASHRQLPDRQGRHELAARHHRFARLAAGHSPAGQ